MKNIDFRNGRPLVMMVSQYDYGYNLQLALWSNGTPVTITAAEIVSENFTVACTFSGNVVTIPVTTSMTERFGHFPAELRVTDSTGQISSKNFDWFVERSPLAVKSTETYSGDIVEFTAKRVPLSSVVVTMEPIQDLNGYDAPWPAGGGKNKLDIDNRHSSSNDHILVCNCSLDAGTYTISATVESTSPSETCLVLLVYEDNTNSENAYLSNNTRSSVTITATKKVIRVRFYSATTYNTSQNYTIQMSNAQIESGSTATAWEPYSNVCPITGRTGASVVVVGKNLFADKGQGYWRVSDGAFITSGTTTQRYRSCEKIPVIAGAQYTGFVKSTYDQPTSVYVQWWGADGTGREVRVTQWPVVAPDDAVLMSFAFRFESPEIASTAIDVIQIEAGSTPTEYEANTTTTYPITFTSAGTVYAGTVDLVSGRLEVTHGGYTFTGDETFGMNGGNTNIIYFNGNSLANPMKSGTWNDDENTLCSSFEKVMSNADFGIRFGANSKYIYFYQILNTLGIASIADWKTWLASNNVQITYPLETPLTYNLTPTQVMSLLGENIVWSPDGEIEVVVPEYY